MDQVLSPNRPEICRMPDLQGLTSVWDMIREKMIFCLILVLALLTHDIPLTFDSRINQFDLMMAFNINQMMLPGDDDDLWHIYVKPGVGITHQR